MEKRKRKEKRREGDTELRLKHVCGGGSNRIKKSEKRFQI